MRLILASASPRRAHLLRTAGFEFAVCRADVNEAVRPGESPVEYVRRLASAKSAAVFEAGEDVVVLGADTAVVVDGMILGKPQDDDDAAQMLRLLSGRRHDVLTGVSVRTQAHELVDVDTTAVFFSPLSDADIGWYVVSGEGRDKAGAYAIQGLASRFVPRIEGSYSNVVGLPVAMVSKLIRACEVK